MSYPHHSSSVLSKRNDEETIWYSQGLLSLILYNSHCSYCFNFTLSKLFLNMSSFMNSLINSFIPAAILTGFTAVVWKINFYPNMYELNILLAVINVFLVSLFFKS